MRQAEGNRRTSPPSAASSANTGAAGALAKWHANYEYLLRKCLQFSPTERILDFGDQSRALLGLGSNRSRISKTTLPLPDLLPNEPA
jgi:hypothetical protein